MLNCDYITLQHGTVQKWDSMGFRRRRCPSLSRHGNSKSYENARHAFETFCCMVTYENIHATWYAASKDCSHIKAEHQVFYQSPHNASQIMPYRTIIFSLPGPVPIYFTRTPTNSSMNSTYFRAFTGNSLYCLMPTVLDFQPGILT